MNRRRTVDRTLTGTRIYIRDGSFKYFSREPILNPKTGKVTKWHTLCKVAEGERAARMALDDLLGATAHPGAGDFGRWFAKWQQEIFAKREADCPRDPVRREIWRKGSKALANVLALIERAFAKFDLADVTPADVAAFVDQWEGRRAAQMYRGHLSKFFGWCCRRGILERNPAREVTVATPKKRQVYFDNARYGAIHDRLAAGSHNQQMTAIYMDLLYLFYQRATDIRLLRQDQIKDDWIAFKPTKTEHSSGAQVKVPIAPDARRVFAQAKGIAKLRSMYLIHDEQGQPFDARHIGDIFRAACRAACVEGVTLKDIRSKAATDAEKAGYSENQIQTALAHTDGATTRLYLRGRDAPVSEVILSLPKW